MKKTNYQIQVDRVKETVPKICIGQEINTSLGIGIVTEMSIPQNGLYLSPERLEIKVWYGMEKALESTKATSFVFTVEELRPYNLQLQ
jgi:hypothetical protein